MKTIQQKEFNYEDILLYNITNNQIIAIVDDKEQLEKFKFTGLASDAPICRLPYSAEIEAEILSKMKKIKEYVKTENCIEIRYKDNSRTRVALESEDVVKKNLEEQNKRSKEVISSAWMNMPEEEKHAKKEKAKSDWKSGLAIILAALSIYSVGKNKNKIMNYIDKNVINHNPKQNEEVVQNNTSNSTLNYNSEENTVVVQEEYAQPQYVEETNNDLLYSLQAISYDFTELGRELYKETCDKDNFVLKYQQVVNINWNEELATNVVELINGKYPESWLTLSDEDAYARATETLQAYSLLLTGNLNPETSHSNMIDLTKYFLRDQDKVIVNNAMAVCRNAMDETIGEPMNGQIIDEHDYASVDKFSREYLGAVDQCLNYQYDTLHDPKFQEMYSMSRWTVSTIFQLVDNTVPQWQSIDKNGTTIYYRNFVDNETGDVFYPVVAGNAAIDYISTQTGKRYNMYEMFAMAGIPLVEEQRNTENYVNPNIEMVGIGSEVDASVLDAKEDVYGLREIADIAVATMATSNSVVPPLTK